MQKQRQQSHTAIHQTVGGPMKIHNGKHAIEIGFTDKKLSPHAGSAAFWAFLRPSGFLELLQKCLPHPPARSNNHLKALDKALGFIQGLLCGAQKLTQVAYLRRDGVVAEILGIARVASQSTLSRFFGVFNSPGKNLQCFGPLWQWCVGQLAARKEGYSLDLDSTRLLHEDGHQEGVAVGYTRLGNKPCLHPLVGVLEEAKLVAGFWLRAGNCACANNVMAFTVEMLERLPAWLKIRLVRADSGFCDGKWLDLLEGRGLRYIVVARLLQPVKNLLIKGLEWKTTQVHGTCVAELWHFEKGWSKKRRLILVRHEIKEKKRPGGKKLVEVPGYMFQALVTNLGPEVAPIAVWRDYNGRAGCENVIKELDEHFALPRLILAKFYATEAALSLAVLSYNLVVLFQKKLGWVEGRVTAGTLRYWLFITAGTLGTHAGKTRLKLAVPPSERDWWQRLWEKILSPHPNCNAVGLRP